MESVNATCTQCNQKFYVKDPLSPRGPRVPLILKCSHVVCEKCLTSSLLQSSNITCKKCDHVSTDLGVNMAQIKDVMREFPVHLNILGSLALHYEAQPQLQDSSIRFMPAGAQFMSARAPFQPTVKKSGATFQLFHLKHSTQELKKIMCDECPKKEAVWKCKQCAMTYCNSCFKQVHSFKANRSHEKTALVKDGAGGLPMQPSALAETIGVCKEHSTKRLDFFCRDCGECVCGHCIVPSDSRHRTHNVVAVGKMNEEYFPVLQSGLEVANGILQQLLDCELTLSATKGLRGISEQEEAVNSVAQQYVDHFAWLHAALQLKEASILERLRAASFQADTVKQEAQDAVKQHLQRVKNLIQSAEGILDNTLSADLTHMVSLTKDLKDLQQLPCRLAMRNQQKHFRCEVDVAQVEGLLKNYDLEFPSLEVKLVKEDDVGVDWILLAVPEADTSQPALSLSTGSQNSSVCEPDTDDRSSVSGSREVSLTNDPQQPTRGYIPPQTQEVVKVCHIKDPSNFYVLRIPDAKFLQDLSVRMQRSALKQRQIPPREAIQGQMFLAKYTADDKWYRCRLRTAPRTVSNVNLVEVVYVDYGNCDVIPVAELRSLPHEFSAIPPLALHCTIAKAFPRNGGTWDEKAIKWLAKVANNTHFNCSVYSFNGAIYEVDIGQVPGDASKGVPLSVADALIFLEYGQLADRSNVADMQMPKPGFLTPKQQASFYENHSFEKGDAVDVMVCHVETPHRLYAQRMDATSKFIVSYTEQLTSMYAEALSRCRDKHPIYAPTVGMACAALFPVDGKWYRAKVLALPGQQKVDIQYVDYGNQATVMYTDIRILQEQFMHHPPLAVPCALADVAPTTDKWSPEATSSLVSASMDKVLKLYVLSAATDEAPMSVLLKEIKPSEEICLNYLLVEGGHALSTGDASSECTMVKYPVPTDVGTVLTDVGTVLTDVRPVLTDVRPVPTDVRPVPTDVRPVLTGVRPVLTGVRPVLPDLRLMIINDSGKNAARRVSLKNKASHSKKASRRQVRCPKPVALPPLAPKDVAQPPAQDLGAPVEADTQVPTARFKEPPKGRDKLRIQVEIVRYLSPDAIFVTLLPNIPMVKAMMADMAVFYHLSRPQLHHAWQANDMCAVFREQDRKWYRGIFLDFYQEEYASVTFRDIATKEYIKLSNLRTLDEKFKVVRDGAFMCHLGGILPAGGGTVWPQVAHEYGADFFKTHAGSAFHITKKGEVTHRSLPIELLVVESVCEGPLDPVTEHIISLNKCLLDEGLALPVRGDKEVQLYQYEEVMHELEDMTVNNGNFNNVPLQCIVLTPTDDVCASDVHASDVHASDVVSDEVRQLDWLPVTDMDLDSFEASPTYVDHLGYIYVHDHVEARQVVTFIQAKLQEHFSQPRPKLSWTWEPQQMCIAKYYLDGNWYRARTIQVDANGDWKVVFVDYGNEEICSERDMVPSKILREIPVQCHKCYLSNVAPVARDGHWTLEGLDFLHTSVVDQRCTVTMVNPSGSPDPLPIQLLRFDGLNISAHMVNNGYARFVARGSMAPPNASWAAIESSSSPAKKKGAKTQSAPYCISPQPSTSKAVFEPYCNLDGIHYGDGDTASGVTPLWSDEIEQDEDVKDMETCSSTSSNDYATTLPASKSGESCGKAHRSKSSSKRKAEPDASGKGTTSVMNASGVFSVTNQSVSSVDGPAGFGADARSSCSTVDLASCSDSNPDEVYSVEDVEDVEDDKDDEGSVDGLMEEAECLTLTADGEMTPVSGVTSPDIFQDALQGKESAFDAVPGATCDRKGKTGVSPGQKLLTYAASYLPTEDEFTVTVKTAVSPTEINVLVIREDTPAQLAQLMKLEKTIQIEAPDQPLICEPIVGMPCVALIEEKWIRCEVTHVDAEKKITVWGIDDGSIETIDWDYAVQLKQEWTALPAMLQSLQLWNICASEDYTPTEATEYLLQVIKDKLLTAQVKVREPRMFVELVNLDGLTLAYQQLLDAAVFVKKD